MALLALLAACGSQTPHLEARLEASQYLARARHDYTPPGPAEDPWGPYVVEAASRFDVPERWIREVMRVESGGRAVVNGQPITSPVGAMGLMQVMPQTYDQLRAQYGLGDDPYDPHNSILAGAAYIRQMYDLYGSPGFLAAYNAGPRRLEDYLVRGRALPDETRRYVAMIGPYIQDSYPLHRSTADQLAMNAIPIDIPPGPRWGRAARQYAQAGHRAGHAPAPAGRFDDRRLRVAQVPEPPRPVAETAIRPVLAFNAPPPPPPLPHGRGGLLLSRAYAADVPLHRGGEATGSWAVQVGAYATERLAQTAIGTAREQVSAGRGMVGSVRQGHATLYRARVVGLSRETAVEACQKLQHTHRGPCMVLSPEAQS